LGLGKEPGTSGEAAQRIILFSEQKITEKQIWGCEIKELDHAL
jgi:hypothetical protein